MTIELKYKITFDGGEADNNRLPGHEGAVSIEGLVWSITLLSNYAVTGEIRARGSMSPKLKVFLKPARQGSYISEVVVFVTEPENIYLTSIIGTYAAATLGQIVNAIIVSSFRGVCGIVHAMSHREEKWLEQLPSGDREALVDKIEPSMRRAHSVVDEGVDTIAMQKGVTPLLVLDGNSKAYVNADLLGDETIRTVSVGGYNANSRNGRLFLPDVGKTVSFKADKDLDPNTYKAISQSLDCYVNGWPSMIEVACTEILAHDGRVKKLLVHRAFKIES